LVVRREHRPVYELRDGQDGAVLDALDGVQWADWARDGDLLTAGLDGVLRIRAAVTLDTVWELDLAALRPPR
jgi:hypothetical protein